MQLVNLLPLVLLAGISAWSTTVSARPAEGTRTLVVLPSVEAKDSYSTFLGGLKATEESFGLVEYDERSFDHFVVLAPEVPTFGGELGVANLLEFVNKGGNVLLAASSSISEAIRDFAYEFSVDFDESGTGVIDHFHKADASDATLVAASSFVGNKVAVPHTVSSGAPVLFRGVGHRLTGKNVLMQPLLTGSPTAYAYDLADREVLEGAPLIGSGLVYVSAVQARNNARVVFAGSVEMFSDDFADREVDGQKSGNKAFVEAVSRWAFQETGVLRVMGKKHHRVNETDQHGIYRIKDDMIYEIAVSEWTGSDWHPYSTRDMQFEAVMLDPYIRTNLVPSSSGIFSAAFRLPDQYGVFTFKVDYRRHGYTWIDERETVQVRPYRHDQYPRFLTQAFPYYVNVFSLAAAFVLFSAVFLWNKEVPTVGRKIKSL
ncbi:hypothetical protein HKX48_008331 [Thoreauomyces humboldtii]|nr:hypothetical protein HKX48_008331 [Thoreauomyces humboldtii]